MLTSNVSQDRTIPYWDEIRNLSIEDKYSLIAKIESSLGDVDMSESTNSIHGIPREVMIAAAEYALKENRAGRCWSYSCSLKNFVQFFLFNLISFILSYRTSLFC